MMPSGRVCEDCGALLAEDDPDGLCPGCLILFAGEAAGDPRPGAGTVLQRLGDYDLLEEIAAGGMGVVYRARQRSLNRLVAVKMLLGGKMARPLQVQRFRTEAEAAANLDHPNIVPIYEISEEGGQPFFSMKLIEGRSLAELLAWGGSIPGKGAGRDRWIGALLAKIARAVHHAHQRGVLHRDLKPSNILVDDQGVCHVTDFGLAKLLEHDLDLTQSGSVLGTACYMSPEQAAGKTKQITTATDIYSLGVVLYELLTGRAPFAGDDPFWVMRQVVEVEPARPRTSNPEVEPDLETICLKCLEKDPRRRYATAEALAEDLERWSRGEPIAARPVRTWERMSKWVRRRPVTAGLVAAIASSLILGLMAARSRNEATHEREQAAASELRRRLQSAEDHLSGGNTPLALAALAEVLREQPDCRMAEERLINVLRQRAFLVPLPRLSEAGSAPGSEGNRSDGRRLRGVGTNAIEVLSTDSRGGSFIIAEAHSRVIRSLNWSADGKFIVSGAADAAARVWDAATTECVLTVLHDDSVLHAELSPDGGRLVTASRDGTARLWGVHGPTRGRPIGEPMRHGDAVNTARFDSSGRWVVTASDDGLARLWGGETGLPACEPLRFSLALDDARFTGGADRVVVTLENGERSAFKVTPGLTLLHADAGAAGLLLEVGTGEEMVSLPLEYEWLRLVENKISDWDASPDGRQVVTASENWTVRIWDVRTRQPSTPGLLHDSPVNCVRFSHDGIRVATSTASRRVRVWDAETGLPLSDWIVSPDPVVRLGFSSDDRWLVTSAGWRWNLHTSRGVAPGWLSDLAEVVAGVRLTGQRTLATVPGEAVARARRMLQSNPGDELVEWAADFLLAAGSENGD